MIDNIYQRIKEYLLKLPLMTWVLLGFFITFFYFFIVTLFLDPSQYMKYFPYNILVNSPIGSDFRSIVFSSSTWIHSGAVPPTLYPPITLMFFVPFTFLNDGTGYTVLTLIILICYVWSTLILPRWINKQKGISAFAMLIFITGLVSYGLQLELERGQWNVVAFTFCLTAIYIFHDHPHRRWLAYLLFSISVQLKLYPAIFVFALIENWSDWKNNIRRFVGLGIVNVLALFIFGSGPLVRTVGSVVETAATHVGLPFNLSVSSFVMYILSMGFLPHAPIIVWLQVNGWLPQLFLFAFFAVCFLMILGQAYKNGSKGFNPWVFMACSIGAFIIPAISFDYKLATFPSSIALSIPAILTFKESGNKFLMILLTFLFSVAYSSTLYPYMYKPEWLQYNLPALLLILTICTILCCVRSEKSADASPISKSNLGMGRET